MGQPFYQRIWQKPPMAFPWIAVGHVAYLVYLVVDAIVDPVGTLMLVQPLYMLLYTIAWLFVCDMKKWAAYAYVGLTTLNLLLRMALTAEIDKAYVTDVIFPADVLFCFFVLFYFKRLQ